MRKSAKIITALSVAGLAVAGGSAFTAGNDFDTAITAPLTGYGTTTVTGATVESLQYNFSDSGANIESTSLVLTGDTLSSSTVQMNYNGTSSFDCNFVGVGLGYDSVADATTYLCGVGVVQLTASLTSTGVVVK